MKTSSLIALGLLAALSTACSDGRKELDARLAAEHTRMTLLDDREAPRRGPGLLVLAPRLGDGAIPLLDELGRARLQVGAKRIALDSETDQLHDVGKVLRTG